MPNPTQHLLHIYPANGRLFPLQSRDQRSATDGTLRLFYFVNILKTEVDLSEIHPFYYPTTWLRSVLQSSFVLESFVILVRKLGKVGVCSHTFRCLFQGAQNLHTSFLPAH